MYEGVQTAAEVEASYVAVVPEPSAALGGLIGAALLGARRRR
ncbi:MAG: PEP-CTERM sorting domain-containing protein [Planctomycetota bacterium]